MRNSNQKPSNAQPTVSDAIILGPGLAIHGARMRFGRNEEIFGEGEAAEHIYRVVAGAVRTSRFSSDGRRQILAFHLPGDVFGIEPGIIHSLSAEAVTEAEVSLIRRSLVETAAAQDARAARALLELMSRQLLESLKGREMGVATLSGRSCFTRHLKLLHLCNFREQREFHSHLLTKLLCQLHPQFI